VTVDRGSVEQKLISGAGDPFLAVAPRLADMLPTQRERLIREHYAVEYRQDLRRLAALGLLDEEDGEEA